MMKVNPLVNRTIKEIFLADNREAIKFVLHDNSEIIARCDAACCSYTWIEDVIDPEAAIGSPIITVTDIDLPEHLQSATKTDNGEEEMQYYGCAIESAKGRFTIAYRNSSNGYYGGWLVWGTADFYGGVYGQQSATTENWLPIKGN